MLAGNDLGNKLCQACTKPRNLASQKSIKSYSLYLSPNVGGSWVAQSVKPPTSAQVMISWFKGLSLTSGSVLTAWSLEPASDSVSPLRLRSVSLSFKNKHQKKFFLNITQCFNSERPTLLKTVSPKLHIFEKEELNKETT